MPDGLITSEAWWRAHYNAIKDHGYQLRLSDQRSHGVEPSQSRDGRRVLSEESECPCTVSPIHWHLVAPTPIGYTNLATECHGCHPDT